MLTLTKEHLQKLDAHIAELPVKYGVPLIQLIQGFAEESGAKQVVTAPESIPESIPSEASADQPDSK